MLYPNDLHNYNISFRSKAVAASSTTQLANSALAVADYCKKAAAVYGNILPPLIIPEPLVRPSTSNNSDSCSAKNISSTPHSTTSAQGIFHCQRNFT